MRLLILKYYFTIACLMLFSAPGYSSYTCDCGQSPVVEGQTANLVASSDIVFLGKVREIVWRTWLEETGEGTEIRARIAVIEAFKGVLIDDEPTLWTHAPPCTASFNPGQIYLFFASISETNSRPYTTYCKSRAYYPIDVPGGEFWPRERIERVLDFLRTVKE